MTVDLDRLLRLAPSDPRAAQDVARHLQRSNDTARLLALLEETLAFKGSEKKAWKASIDIKKDVVDWTERPASIETARRVARVFARALVDAGVAHTFECERGIMGDKKQWPLRARLIPDMSTDYFGLERFINFGGRRVRLLWGERALRLFLLDCLSLSVEFDGFTCTPMYGSQFSDEDLTLARIVVEANKIPHPAYERLRGRFYTASPISDVAEILWMITNVQDRFVNCFRGRSTSYQDVIMDIHKVRFRDQINPARYILEGQSKLLLDRLLTDPTTGDDA